MNMKKILWTLAFVFALQVSASTALAAPKDTVNQVEAYSDTTSLDSAMNAAMGNWDDPDDWDDDWDEWENANSTSLVEKMGIGDGMAEGLAGMVFAVVVLFIIFILSPVALIGIILFFVYKNRKQKMKLMEMAIKSGNTIPLETMAPSPTRNDYLWNKGIKQIFTGVGLAILLYVIIGNLGLAIGAFIAILGIGNMAIGHNAMQKRKEQELYDQYVNQTKKEEPTENEK